MGKEAKARIKINRLLQDSGWRFFDDAHGPANICLENNVKITEQLLDDFGEDFEKTTQGFIDYLLLDGQGFPLAVLEAKREGRQPLDGKEQARRYAQGQRCRFVLLSNGNLHYFWDLESGNPQVISTLPTQLSLGDHTQFKPNPGNLVREGVERDYILLTQKPNYERDPRWQDESQRDAFLADNHLKLLRPYQVRAVQCIQQAVDEGQNRFLFEMATGTGKTLVAGAAIKLFLRTRNARRVLFLVDRLDLERQAHRNFVRYLKNDCITVIYKHNRDDWRRAEIVVTTVQSLLVNNKYRDLFSPTDFDLVISDEAHRSIGGNARAVFEYFVGYKLGLTATPKDYLKNIKNPDARDPREMERRLLLDTYRTFGCTSGQPTFRYSLLDGVADGFLVNPITVDARTEITTQLLSDEGYAVMITDEDGEEHEAIFTHRDFERRFLSDKTNSIFCKTLLENALRDPLTGEVGKTLCFAVSQDHACKLTQILNEMADKLWPGKYNSDFAVQVTSRIPNAQQFTVSFANNNLNQHSRFLEELAGYKTSKTRVCVTVGMMTTGYDCEDLLNLCLMRPIFSPQDFVQMKGRGTRLWSFEYQRRTPSGDSEPVAAPKTAYKLFDFFANCEYFEDKYNYDEVIELPAIGGGEGGGGGGPVVRTGDYANVDPDPLKSLKETPIGLEGMRIDREMFGKFEQTVKTEPFVVDKVQQGDFAAAESYIIEHLFNKPEDYFNLDKLRRAAAVDRRLTLREILEKAFGFIPGFKSREELLDEECDKFIAIHQPSSDEVLPVKNFLKAYVTDPEIRDIIESEQYGRFYTTPLAGDFQNLTPELRTLIPEYVKDYVPLNRFL